MTKIAIISDIHSNITALDTVISDIGNYGCKNILCCGDLIGYGPSPNEVIERIRELDIPTVMGNYDEAVGFLLPACGCHINNPKQKELSNKSLKWSIANTTQENRGFLRNLPESLEFIYESKRLLLNHATFESISEYVYEKDEERIAGILSEIDHDIYIFGHTHYPFIKAIGNKMIVNAGSVGRPKNLDNRATYILLEIEDLSVHGTIKKVSYDIEKVAGVIEQSGLGSYFADFLRNGGDIEEGCSISGPCSCKLE